jgi:hypothetical protein
MTRAQGQEYLQSALRPLVPSDSLEMVIEYLSSYDPFNKIEMVKFLQDVCGGKNFNEIIENYIQLCHKLDQNSAIFVPKQQYFEPKNDGVRKASSAPQSHQQRSQQPHHQQQPQQQSQRTFQPAQQDSKKQLPNQNESLTFVADKKYQESSNQHQQQNKKQQQSQNLGNRPPNRNRKTKNLNPSEKLNDSQRQICGCFATHHDYCTSCMSCGRIHCSVEGFGTCIFCGSNLFPPLSAEIVCDALGYQDNNEIVHGAYLQKDKLLQFDKEHAKRTQVHDAQVC